MDVQALESLPDELAKFASAISACAMTKPSQRHCLTYLAGQVTDRPRKSVEPIALAAKIPPRTLQEFLSFHRWDEEAVEACLQERLAGDHAHAQAIAIVDETSFAKKGDRSPGVQRQWCGATGKVDNCMVSVHVGYAAGDFHALLSGELYVPQDWLADAKRCEDAGIPPDLPYRTKWQMALDQLAVARQRGVRCRWVVADELYGRAHEFRLGVADLGMQYVVEIPCNLSGHLAHWDLAGPPRRVDGLWERGGPPWETWKIKETTKGPEVWKVRALRFRPVEEGVAGDEQWLIIARKAFGTPVTKYFLSNAPKDTPLGDLLHVAFARWHVERLFQESKTEIGLDHYEGRTWLGFKRHLVLSAASILFLAEQRKRLRELPDDFGPITLEQVKRAVEVQLDPEMPLEERRRQLARAMEINEYHQRRNEAARRSHEKRRLRELEAMGIDPATLPRCPATL